MDAIVIKGSNALNGTINISGAKNAALLMMAASLLTDQKLILENVPMKLSDINTMCQLLKNHGVHIASDDNSKKIILDASKIDNLLAPYDIVRKMRASILVLGPLLARFGKAQVSLPGGCAIGARKVDLHIDALQALGARITTENGYIHASIDKKRLQGTNFHFNKVSVGATVNSIMAAVLADGLTRLSNCAIEPEIVNLCNCLIKMGAQIQGIGTSTLEISGIEKLNGVTHTVIPDRIEAGTYMIAAAITRGYIRITNIIYDHLEALIIKLKLAGANISHDNKDIIIDCRHLKLNAVNIQTNPYPGFNTDLQAQFMSLMTLASGTSIITENIFENRYMHVCELVRMGANINIEGNNAIIKGVPRLQGAEVMASDLRASASLVLAGLASQGTTTVHRVYHLYRGYEDLITKLSNCGANIKVINK